MAKQRKTAVQFFISVEGENCEEMYFKHLAKLINSSGCNAHDAKVYCKKIMPESFAKRNAHLPADKSQGKRLPYFHIQDVEDFGSSEHQKIFYALLDEIHKTEAEYGIKYELGYSNFTFELWMLLHVADMKYALTDRYAYLKPINQYFHRSFLSLSEFKKKDNFQSILNEYVTLDSVWQAIKRADSITAWNENENRSPVSYRKFHFYAENPDLTVQEVIKIIFSACKVAL